MRYNFSKEKAFEMKDASPEKLEEIVKEEVKALTKSLDEDKGYSVEASTVYGIANIISWQFEKIRKRYNDSNLYPKETKSRLLKDKPMS